MELWIYIAAMLLLLVVGAELLLRTPTRFAIAFWVVVPLLLLPIWLQHAADYSIGWFLWVKTASLIFACLFCVLCRSRRGPELPVGTIGIVGWLILSINILEAVVQDAKHGSAINAIAGLSLIIAMPSWRKFTVESSDGRNDLLFPLSWSWVLAYTAWNACFFYEGWETRPFAQHLAVLGAVLIIAVRRGPASWFQGRAFTLGLYLLAYNTAYPWFYESFNSTTWYRGDVAWVLQSLSLSLAVLTLAMPLIGNAPGLARGRRRPIRTD